MLALLVEDNPDIALSVSAVLSTAYCGHAYDVIHVTNLKDALAALERNEFGVAIVDLGLPDARGIEAPQVLSRTAPQLPVVVFTAHESDVDALALIHHGIQDYLVKTQASARQIRQAVEFAIERKRLEVELRRQASYDPLTGLLNRRGISKHLLQALSHADRTGRRAGALIVDLDRFKAMNDSLGHAIGDAILKEVATRLRSTVRAGDSVGRIGGDEFLVVLEALNSADEALIVATKVSESLNGVFAPDGGTPIPLGASIGAAVYPDHAKTARELMALADRAMYRAKASPTDRCVMHDLGSRRPGVRVVGSASPRGR
jgi:diguanylate cyclase (GGDEF)-like protein